MTKSLKDFAKATTIAGGTLLGATGAALADCTVYDAASGRYHSQTFSGGSARSIWEGSCRSYLQETIARNNVRSGTVSMSCSGRLSCSLRGRIINGRIQMDRLDFGDGSSSPRAQAPVAPTPQPEWRPTRQQTETRQAPVQTQPRVRTQEAPIARPVEVAPRTRTEAPVTRTAPSFAPSFPSIQREAPATTRSHPTYSDPGWAALDRAIENCQRGYAWFGQAQTPGVAAPASGGTTGSVARAPRPSCR